MCQAQRSPNAHTRCEKTVRKLSEKPVSIILSAVTPDIWELSPGSRWGLRSDYYFHWEFESRWYRFLIPAGFEFDGASVPWFLRWIAGRGRFGLLAPLVHDWLHAQKGSVAVDWDAEGTWVRHYFASDFTRQEADKMFFLIMRYDGVEPRWLRRCAYKAVRLWSIIKRDAWEN